MNLITQLNFDGVTPDEAVAYETRRTVRAVVTDDKGNIALFHATKNAYYKLPGGGIESDESNEEAIARECLEEIGCKVKITGEVGTIVEFRKEQRLVQTSYCYTARVIGPKGVPQLMADEVEEGFQPEWVPLDTAIRLMKDIPPAARTAHRYMALRDLTFLEVYKKLTQ